MDRVWLCLTALCVCCVATSSPSATTTSTATEDPRMYSSVGSSDSAESAASAQLSNMGSTTTMSTLYPSPRYYGSTDTSPITTVAPFTHEASVSSSTDHSVTVTQPGADTSARTTALAVTSPNTTSGETTTTPLSPYSQPALSTEDVQPKSTTSTAAAADGKTFFLSTAPAVTSTTSTNPPTTKSIVTATATTTSTTTVTAQTSTLSSRITSGVASSPSGLLTAGRPAVSQISEKSQSLMTTMTMRVSDISTDSPISSTFITTTRAQPSSEPSSDRTSSPPQTQPVLTSSSDSNRTVYIVVGVVVPAFAIVIIALAVFLLRRKRFRPEAPGHSTEELPITRTRTPFRPTSIVNFFNRKFSRGEIDSECVSIQSQDYRLSYGGQRDTTPAHLHSFKAECVSPSTGIEDSTSFSFTADAANGYRMSTADERTSSSIEDVQS